MSCAERASPQGPIFIGGTGRSGTTVLVRMLGRHPNILSLRWETQFIVAPGGLLNLARRGFRKRELEIFLERLRGRWFHRMVRSGKPDQYAAGLSFQVTGEELEAAIAFLCKALRRAGRDRDNGQLVAEFTQAVFEPAVGRIGASRWCEKTPRNILFVDRLFEVFPDMRFIHIIRDGRDVVASMLDRGFWPIASGHEFPALSRYRGTIVAELAARYWIDVLEISRQVSSGVPADNYLELKFEELIRDPEKVYAGLCEFLGEEFDPQPLAQDLSRHHIGRWRNELKPRQVAAVEEIAAEALRREGYL